MEQNCYYYLGSGIQLHYSFLYPETRKYFDNYLTEHAEACPCFDVRVTSEYMEENRWLVDEDERCMPFLEFQALMLATGNMLLEHVRALFHGAAAFWRGRAFLLTAPSGTGKTTQLRHWKKILGKDMKAINGDKPLLECREDGTIWVHSSPWRGKERIGIAGLSAELGGILFLKQGEENRIKRLDTEDAVLPLFTAFVSYPEDTRQLEWQARILSRMLDCVPVWELTNRGDRDSAVLTIETLQQYLEEHHD